MSTFLRVKNDDKQEIISFLAKNDEIKKKEYEKFFKLQSLISQKNPFYGWCIRDNENKVRGFLGALTHHSPHHKNKLIVNKAAPGSGRKVALYATCFSNYNSPAIGESALAVLAHNGVEVEVVYPRCCGMPYLEKGDIAGVVENAEKTAQELCKWIDNGYEIVALVPSCAFMIKLEWPLLMPENPNIKRLSEHSFDIAEYIVSINRDEGLVEGLKPIGKNITLHMACHARAQNIGHKAAEMLRLVPNVEINVIERCSGHGGSIGVTRDFHETALKVGRPLVRRISEHEGNLVASECPLAAAHIMSGIDIMHKSDEASSNNSELKADDPLGRSYHPIELFAKAYGLVN